MKRQQKQRPHARALNEPKTTLSQSIKDIKGKIPLEGFDETETECLAEKDINAIVNDKTDPVRLKIKFYLFVLYLPTHNLAPYSKNYIAIL